MVRFTVPVVTALIYGATWWQEGNLSGEYTQLSQINNILGSIYSGLSFMGAASLSTARLTIARSGMR